MSTAKHTPNRAPRRRRPATKSEIVAGAARKIGVPVIECRPDLSATAVSFMGLPMPRPSFPVPQPWAAWARAVAGCKDVAAMVAARPAIRAAIGEPAAGHFEEYMRLASEIPAWLDAPRPATVTYNYHVRPARLTTIPTAAEQAAFDARVADGLANAIAATRARLLPASPVDHTATQNRARRNESTS